MRLRRFRGQTEEAWFIATPGLMMAWYGNLRFCSVWKTVRRRA